MAASHPLAVNSTLEADDLLATHWVLREPGSGTRAAFEHAVERAGLDPARPTITLTLPANEAVLSAVEAGAGATVISTSAAAAGLRSGAPHRLRFDLPARPYWLLRHKERYRSKVGDAFLALASEPA